MTPYQLVGEVRLRPGREASAARRHPWVYRGALAAGEVPPGPVLVRSAEGAPLGVALAQGGGGSLALRFLTWGTEPWTRDTLRARLAAARALRERLHLDSEAFRLVHAEGDGLPGLVVDRYGPWAVVEPYMAAWEPFLPDVAEVLCAEQGAVGVLLRRPGGVEALRGRLPPGPVPVREGGWLLLADLVGGQKTGLFLDQRDNRLRLAGLARERAMLNLFSYSGGFGVAARWGGARRVVHVDTSAAALELARRTWEANGWPLEGVEFVRADAFHFARQGREKGARFDLVVVDPPAFVPGRAHLARGLAGYREINRLALGLVAAGGLLLTCSCSALVGEQQFAEALLTAALEAGRQVAVLERRGAGPDHPVSLFCPETRHLKAWLCAVD